MKYFVWILVAVIVVGGVFYFVMRNQNDTNTNTTTNSMNDNTNMVTPNLNTINSNANLNTAPTTNTNANTNASPATASVSISNMAFQPATLTIAPNTTVTWTNNDSLSHTVTGTGFESGTIAPGKSYTHTFASAGTFAYHCSFHPSMTATVKVQ